MRKSIEKKIEKHGHAAVGKMLAKDSKDLPKDKPKDKGGKK